jgi:hypothetical protein
MENKNSFLSELSRSYSFLLDLSVYISEFFLFCWILAVFFFESGEKFLETIYFFLILFIILFKLYPYLSERSEKIETIGNLLGKVIPFIGSLFVLVLFLNLYFPIYPSLREYFSDFWKMTESLLNEFVITLLIIFIFFMAPLDIAYGKFLFEGMKRMGNKKEEKIFIIVGSILLIGVEVGLIYWVNFLTTQQSPLTLFIKSNLKLIFGFSLFFIHLNFIIRKVGEFFKRFSKVEN